jgi:DNA-binding NarL/FixJ family response regulator
VKGRSNKEIAGNLSISEDTLKSHLKTIFSKLGVQDRTAAAISGPRARHRPSGLGNLTVCG